MPRPACRKTLDHGFAGLRLCGKTSGPRNHATFVPGHLELRGSGSHFWLSGRASWGWLRCVSNHLRLVVRKFSQLGPNAFALLLEVFKEIGALREELRSGIGGLREDNALLRKDMNLAMANLAIEMHKSARTNLLAVLALTLSLWGATAAMVGF